MKIVQKALLGGVILVAALVVLTSIFPVRAAEASSPVKTATVRPNTVKARGTGIRLATRDALLEKIIIQRAPEMMQGHPNDQSPAQSGWPLWAKAALLLVGLGVGLVVFKIWRARRK